MKKTYVQPSLKTYKVNLQKILAGSDTEQPYGVKNGYSTLGDEYYKDDVSYSRTNNIIIIDDDDDSDF